MLNDEFILNVKKCFIFEEFYYLFVEIYRGKKINISIYYYGNSVFSV